MTEEIGPLTPVLPCTHIWVRKGLGSGTSKSTTIWGATTCVLCGAMQSGSSEVPAEAHTVDVGHVHVLTTPGGPCASGSYDEWWCPTDERWVLCPGPCPDGSTHEPQRTIQIVVMPRQDTGTKRGEP